MLLTDGAPFFPPQPATTTYSRPLIPAIAPPESLCRDRASDSFHNPRILMPVALNCPHLSPLTGHMLKLRYSLTAACLLLTCTGLALAQEAPPAPAPTPPALPATPPPEPAPSVSVPDSVPANPRAPTPRPAFRSLEDTMRDNELRRREEALARTAMLRMRRQTFLNDTSQIHDLERLLAVLPMDAAGPKPPAMKTVQKQSNEVRKKIPRMIEFLGGKKPKRSKPAPAYATTADAVIAVLSVLKRVNTQLLAIARNEHVVNPAMNEKLINDLIEVRETLLRLQRPF